MVCHSCQKTKIKYKKGLWSPEEDKMLTDCVNNYGHACWSVVPKRAGLQRNGKSCRLRWINYLRPGLKRGAFTTEEEQKVISLHAVLGNKWSQMATQMPGRTDNEIKNYWNSYLKKRVHEKSYSKYSINPDLKTDLTNSQLDMTLDTLTTNSTLCYESNSKSLSVNSPDSSSSNPTGARSTNKGPKILFEEWRSMDVCGDHKQDVNSDSTMSLQVESFDSIIDNYWESCYFFDEFVWQNKFELMSC